MATRFISGTCDIRWSAVARSVRCGMVEPRPGLTFEFQRSLATLIARRCAEAFGSWRARTALSMLALLAGAVSARSSRAAVTEPNGLTLPQPLSSTELIAASGTNAEVRLDRLVVARGEAFDTVLDAYVPAGWVPECDVTAQLVLRGGTCEVELGWYNIAADAATPTAPPPPEQI